MPIPFYNLDFNDEKKPFNHERLFNPFSAKIVLVYIRQMITNCFIASKQFRQNNVANREKEKH